MRLQSKVQDALYLNWALPVEALPAPPAPLRYQTRPLADEEGATDGASGGEMAFASVLLFHHHGVHLRHLPFVRLSYPQLNLRLYVLDDDHVPGVLFLDMMMPWWVGPAVRAVAQSPASAARFSLPRPSSDPAAREWVWRVEGARGVGGALNGGEPGRLRVTGRRGSGLAMTATAGGAAAGNACSAGMFSSWRETVRFFRERSRGYVVSGGELRRVETEHPQVEVWPMTVEVEEDSLLQQALPLDGGGLGTGNLEGEAARGWPCLHSAWLCPEIPLVFDLAAVPQAAAREEKVDLEATLPQPASTRSAQPAAAAARRNSVSSTLPRRSSLRAAAL